MSRRKFQNTCRHAPENIEPGEENIARWKICLEKKNIRINPPSAHLLKQRIPEEIRVNGEGALIA